MTVPVLNGCTTPLHFFHALLPLTLFDHVTERTNAYAENLHARGKENTPPSLSTRSQSADDEEGKLAWTATTAQEILALVGCVICMGMVKINRCNGASGTVQIAYEDGKRILSREVSKGNTTTETS